MIEKILERLKTVGWVFAEYFPDETAIHRVTKKSIPYDAVVEIVQEVAKDGGWIPCSERLPEKYRICWITWKVDGYSEEVYRATCYKWGWFCIDTQEEFEPHEVVAWKYYEKPAPYQKGE